jgi:RNA polymerase sigma-70 factor (ECF subfamily)
MEFGEMKPGDDPAGELPAARAGSREALGQVLEACRGYLLVLAQQELDPHLRAKGGASDLVQETLADAVGAFADFHGTSTEELRRWLRRILLNNLVSFARRYRDADKRQVSREVALQTGSSSADVKGAIPADPLSPSGEAIKREQAEAIQKAMERLPDDYRQVILLRYQEEHSFEDIGRLMNLTPNAARKLWLRAIKRLRQESEGSS